MKRTITAIVALLVAAATLCNAQRTRTNIDFDWEFRLDSDTEWRTLDLPHDWSIEGEYKENNPGGKSVAFLPSGLGWYRKALGWSEEWTGKRVFVLFEGIFCNSTVSLNGTTLGYRPNGYVGLCYDLTDALEKGGENVITVKVDNTLQPAARWYTGSGIYRHVYLTCTDNIFVPNDGTYVTTPSVSTDAATVKVRVEIRNYSGAQGEATVVNRILDKAGRQLVRSVPKSVKLIDNFVYCDRNTVFEDSLTLASPALWSPETPTLYTLETIVSAGGKEVDRYQTTFGVRRLEFIPDKGFFLNGEFTLLKGACLHQNTGPVGSAMPDDLWHKRLLQLKEMGCNALRTSHYPYPPVFYDMCDSLGFMVMDEAFDGWYHWDGYAKAKYDYGYYFLDWWEKDIEDFIRRDRNHPCVVLWSTGNEVWGWDKHQYLQYLICKKYHDLDGTRPTTQAWADGVYLDICGFNGNGENVGQLLNFHKKQPGKLGVGTEIPHTRSTRSVYRTIGDYRAWTGPENISAEARKNLFPVDRYTEEELFPDFDARYASAYDNQTRRNTVREQWKQTRDYDFFIGEFRWTAYDYLGESWGWPSRTNNYGIIDMCGFPKDNYYLYQSLWTTKPMVHILPHWTWPGMEGKEIPVVVYTNGDEGELFYNGRSLGKKQMDSNVLQLLWYVPYRKGSLTAVAYREGREIARETISSSDRPSAVRLTPDRLTASPNRRDVICITVDIVDSNGRMNPTASNLVNFSVEGPCKLLGVENGDILDMDPQKVLYRKAFMGKALLMLQTTSERGSIKVKATSDGLRSSSVTVKVR